MLMTREEAKEFFAEFYLGEHHIPKYFNEFGHGWAVKHYGDLATFDSDGLTRLVLMAHEKAIRVSIIPASPKELKIAIHKRERTGSLFQRHPSLGQVLALTPTREE